MADAATTQHRTHDHTHDRTRAEPREPRDVSRFRSLSGKFLLLTIAFVMVIEMLILVPSVANYRETWLAGRIEQSRAALGVLDRLLGDDMMSDELLMAFDAEAIVLRDAERTARIGPAETPGIMHTVIEGERGPLGAIAGAWRQLTDANPMSLVRLVGEPDASGRQIELVVRSGPLRDAMLRYMRNIVLISLLIAVVTALLVFAAARALLIRPIQRMSDAMLGFAAAPADASRIIRPEPRRDELGVAQRQLADMQGQVHATLRQQRRLAELGLAVSKINHDMRNILSTAQLVSDRLADVDDPVVQRVAPRLIRALDRAVTYSEGVLEYGRADEAPPRRERTDLAALAADVRDLALPEPDDAIAFDIEAPPRFTLSVDREQMLRVLLNLARNAVQAIRRSGEGGRITLAARADGRDARIELADTGPGLPEGSADTLFAPFGASATRGGSGLGLAIARELVEAHGGTISASGNVPHGTRIVIDLPGAVD